jgi:hypothetical protein
VFADLHASLVEWRFDILSAMHSDDFNDHQWNALTFSLTIL